MDERLLLLANGLAGQWPWLGRLTVFLASDFFLPVLIAAASWSLWFFGRNAAERLQHQMGFIYAAGGAALANLLIQVLNQSFYRPRPFLVLEDVNTLFYRPTDSSFPSNAAAFAFAMAAGVWLVRRPLGVVIGIAALLFSAARVFAGMHYPLDVVGGALFGVLSAYAFFRVLVVVFQPVFSLLFKAARFFYLA